MKIPDRYKVVVFRPSVACYCDRLPSKCPYDSEPLVWLPNVYSSGRKGLCCLRCYRLFSLKRPVQAQQRVRQSPYPFNLFSQSRRCLGDPEIEPTIPSSTILIAHLGIVNQKRIGCIAIVADVHEQDSSKGIYWVGRELPSMILAAIQINKRRQFEYKGVKYKVISYENCKNAQKYLDIIARFYNPLRPQIVYVFAHKNIHQFGSANYEMVTAMVPCSNAAFPVPITVYFEKSTGRYFMNEVSYQDIRKRFGLPYLRIEPAAAPPGTKGFKTLRAHSELYMLGYSVSEANGPTMEERRRLLSNIIDSGILSKGEVINHLEWLIRMRWGAKYSENAIGEWQADIRFLMNYRADEQRRIWVSEFRAKYNGLK